MASLDRNLRKQLETAVKTARRAAEGGAHQAIEQLAVHHHEPWSTLTPEQRQLRNRLRAHGRQLGDRRDDKRGSQAVDRVVAECAYEHWHRLLFARFLAENDLLVEPQSGMALSLGECRELARDRGVDWLALASDFAQRMLPQIFRIGDPVLDVSLPPETRQQLEDVLATLPQDVFIADDSLGWVYQFWQAEQKDAINRSEKKIGADEIAAVTQLFTEDYMVLFLLHNTLGAWWAGKVLAAHPDLARTAESEDELRRACALPGVDWRHLRFSDEGDSWRPAAGTFDTWPKSAQEITVLDPCMGSGHFLVFILPILAAMRAAEEQLSVIDSVEAVLRDNLFGLEIDSRCTQIAAFNLALTAWRSGGYRGLPTLQLACSGLSVGAKDTEWLLLADGDERLRTGMTRLHALFQQGPILGSLIDPRALGGDVLEAGYRDLAPMLEKAVAREHEDQVHEVAVTASGLAKAAAILSRQFTLVATNVPYLGRPDQAEILREFCERSHPTAKADLATCFLERCLASCSSGGTAAVVTPQSWLFQSGYRRFRERLLADVEWNLLARLGPRAFETISGERVNVCLILLSSNAIREGARFAGLDVSHAPTADTKATELATGVISIVSQSDQRQNPDSRIALGTLQSQELLNLHASCVQGLATSDDPQFTMFFWELPSLDGGWEGLMGTVDETCLYGGRERVLHWEDGRGRYYRHAQALKSEGRLGGWKSGTEARGKTGVLVSQMSTMPVTVYTGEFYDHNASVIAPFDLDRLPAIWMCASSPEFSQEVRKLDPSLKPSNNVFAKVPFDVVQWHERAAKQYPNGLPQPHSRNPTQWLFEGRPEGSEHPLQVGAARLVGYRWPRQMGSSFMGAPALGPDGIVTDAESGIICLAALRGEASAAERLRTLLAHAYGPEWSAQRLDALLKDVGFSGRTLDDWLRDAFFEQHCALFQHRPFIWHISDGLKAGFGALVNYHQLSARNGGGRRTLETLIYTYLGEWIHGQRADQKVGVEGADARVAAAEHLKRELEKILHGEPPYDIFVRWKPIHEQPVGWEPDFNDGVRINIRPFMTARPINGRGKNACILRVSPNIKWEKDRGKDPVRSRELHPWFWGWDGESQDFIGTSEFDGNRWNDLHYSRQAKLAARQAMASV